MIKFDGNDLIQLGKDLDRRPLHGTACMALISALSRARARRLAQTFREVYAETGSLWLALSHTLRFVTKKLVPLARYFSFTLVRLFAVSRLRRRNDRVSAGTPTIAIRILGGVGDFIVIARYLRDLAAEVGPLIFDIYSNRPTFAAWIFAAIPGFRVSHDEAMFSPAGAGYTLAMQISQFVVIEDRWISAGLVPNHPRLARVVDAIRHVRPAMEAIVTEHPRLDNLLEEKAVNANRTRRDYLHFMSGLEYGGDMIGVSWSDAARQRLGLDSRPYVTVHNGYDPNMVVSHERATKCYPHFDQVIKLLRESHPGVTFVQIGIYTSEKIETSDINLLGKTSLSEAAGLIRDALFHIDNESGLVHLAAAMGTRSCVVFGPTPSRYFGYPGNINVDPSFCGGCWWTTETWMNHCPRGFAMALCMTEQPAVVVARAAQALFPHNGPSGTFTTPAHHNRTHAIG